MALPRPPKEQRSRAWFGGLIMGALVALMALGAIISREPTKESSPAALFVLQSPTLDQRKPSVAVLPFATDTPEQIYLGDGIAEDLITDLAKLSGLIVIARPSTFSYKDRALSPVQVGYELGTKYVVSGRASKTEHRVSISVDLHDTTSGALLWAESYDRSFGNLLELLGEVRQGIIATLAVPLTPSERNRIGRPPTRYVAAYDVWAQGLERWNSVTKDTHSDAQHMFARSVEIDPGFARAWGRLARTYLYGIEQGWSDSVDPDLRRSVALAQRAADLDPGQRDAGYVLSQVHLWHREYGKALTEMQRIVSMNPNFADGYVYIGEILIYAGRPEEAIAYVDHATRINPQPPAAYSYVLGHAQFAIGRYRDAASSLEESLKRQPDSLLARRMLVAAYGQLNDMEGARRTLKELQERGNTPDLKALRQTTPYRDAAMRSRLLDGLRAAGAPE